MTLPTHAHPIRTQGPKQGPRRYWLKVDKTPNASDCWLWTAGLSAQGYGWISIQIEDGQRKSIAAHRLAYHWCVRPISYGTRVYHTCRNPICVRPDHLFTRSDRISRRLPLETIEAIRARHAQGDISMAALAREHNLNPKTVSAILRQPQP